VTEPAARGIPWRDAVVREVSHAVPSSALLRLEVPGRPAHLPGQHYIIRLTAEDGYQASRSYSLASTAADPLVEVFIERLADGEVSPYLVDEVRPDDHLEVRGPIGRWFTWSGESAALAVGGGSGVVPLVSMLRRSLEIGRPDLLRLAAFARGPKELPYADELAAGGAVLGFSRDRGGLEDLEGHEVASAAARPLGRVRAEDLVGLLQAEQTAYVCGSAGFAESASALLVELGVAPSQIRVERFGPTG
jgi:ferredoxin-NADP reductase